ncbi:hypothetical protein [Flammeovirga pacifica]|uniref:DUF115 domain-containing protein n=1 Tax=Flammeovirga pacifica TaxID=915059 RepID=A0A1S1YXU0_FLAPC|nr:hypothetical protein [Flammeovirga pacifica]OHX65695.1 hypothetical protein NH26_04690 [Flammeovirga pacifica]
MDKVGLEKTLKDLLPPVFSNKFFEHFSSYQFKKFKQKDLIEENSLLKNTKKGKRCFLIATGPSLKLEDLNLLKGEDCYTISNAFLHKSIKEINPIAHFFAPYHKPLVLENYKDWLKKSDEILPENTIIVTGHKNLEYFSPFEVFPNRDIKYLYFSRHTDKFLDITKPIIPPVTGPQMMIPYLLYLGYEKIYLLGCDSTIMRDFKKASINHFYDTKKEDIRKNASDKNSWGNSVEQFESQLNQFKLYEYFAKQLKGGNQTIINLSKDSWIDCYPFDTLENVINLEKK